MNKNIEFAMVSIVTGKVFSKIFKTENDAKEYISKRHNPENWKVVCREVIYGEWE